MKYYGKVGLLTEPQEVSPGVWNEGGPVEIDCYGDVERSSRAYSAQEHTTNDSIKLRNVISIIANPYLHSNLGLIRYAMWRGTAWEVTDIEDDFPRVKLTLGGVYNGEQA